MTDATDLSFPSRQSDRISPITVETSRSSPSKLGSNVKLEQSSPSTLLTSLQQIDPEEADEADDVHPLPSTTKPVNKQFMRRSTSSGAKMPNGSQSRRTTVTNGVSVKEDWAISPQTTSSNGQSSESLNASRKNSSNSTRGSSIFSVLPFLSSSSSLAPQEDQSESAFVFSRLENSPLDGEEATSPAIWLTDQLKSAIRTFNDTVVGELAPGDVDVDFWQSLVENYEETVRKQPKYFTQQLAKGIPEKLRGLMWQKITKSRSERYFTMYKSLLTRSSNDEKLIIRDLSRTYPTHPYFKDLNGEGQTSLFNVLKAYSIHDPDIGYCQGIAFIVGPLLLNVTFNLRFR
jgi:hypothetical protein